MVQLVWLVFGAQILTNLTIEIVKMLQIILVQQQKNVSHAHSILDAQIYLYYQIFGVFYRVVGRDGVISYMALGSYLCW